MVRVPPPPDYDVIIREGKSIMSPVPVVYPHTALHRVRYVLYDNHPIRYIWEPDYMELIWSAKAK